MSSRIGNVLSSPSPGRTAGRVALSLVRRRAPLLSLRSPVIHVGGCRVRADLETSLGLGLYRYRQLPCDVSAVTSLLAPGDCFIDGGANVGLFTLACSTAVGPAGSVLAVEPGSVSGRLEENIRLNGLGNVRVVRAALSDVNEGERAFLDRSGDAAGLSSLIDGRRVGDLVDGAVMSVRTRTLDSIAAGQRVTVVKLDLEGAEVLALRGATDLLTRVRPRFLVEVVENQLRNFGSTTDELLDVFASFGYSRSTDRKATRPNMWFEPA